MLSNHSNSALAKFKIPNQREAQNEDLCLIDTCQGASGSEQGIVSVQTDGKQRTLSSITKPQGNNNLGVKGSKALKRQHPTATPKASTSKLFQTEVNGSKSLGYEQRASVWVGNVASKQTGSGT